MDEITRNCRHEETLLQSGNIFRLIMDTSHEIITILAHNGTILFKNNTVKNVLGYASVEMIGFSEFDFIHDDDKNHLSEFLKDRSSDGPLTSVEYRCRTSHKGWKWLHSTVIPLKDANGDNNCFIVHSHDISDQKQMEEQLGNMLHEKNVLLKELHHRVRNNLQIVLSILSLQSHKIDDARYYAYLEESTLRIYAISLIHDKLYSSKNMSHVDLYSCIVELLEKLFTTYSINRRMISVRLDIEKAELDIVDAMPCAMIINELLINALTHAFPESHCGTITISLRTGTTGSIILRVQDNGVGLPKDFDIAASKTLGMEIIQILAKQVNGMVDIYRDNGTTVQITF